MKFEPIDRFWIQPTREEMAADNARLKSWLLAAVVVASIGWGVAAFAIILIGRVVQ